MTATIATAPVVRKRRPGGRRGVILAAAIDLFVRQGYQSTGIDEIGAAANISGPAIYRHFASKQDLLAASFDHLLETTRAEWDRILRSGAELHEMSRMFVESGIRTTLEDRLALTLFYREAQHLPPEHRRVIMRLNRQLTRDWAKVLCQLNPALTEPEATTVVDAVTSLIHSALTADRGLSRSRLEPLLNDMAMAALDAVTYPPERTP